MLPIPPDRLSPDVLDALIEEFVTRHGADLTEAPAKAAQVRAQLRSGQVIIVYDEKTDSANIVPKDAKEAPPASPRGGSKEAARHDGPQVIYDEPSPPDPTDY